MPVTQQTHWKTTGTEPAAGVDDEYVVNGQPIAEHDNWINYYLVDDITNTLTALQNTTTGHDHDGVNSKTVDGVDVVNTPAGTIVATDVQSAIDEIDSSKSSMSSGTYSGNNAINRAITHGLSKTPKLVFINRTIGGLFCEIIYPGYIHWLTPTTGGVHAVTTPNSTNFYVGATGTITESANFTSETYYWVAFA